MVPALMILAAIATDPASTEAPPAAPAPPAPRAPGAALLDRVRPHDYLALGCIGAPLAEPVQLVKAMGVRPSAIVAGPLGQTWWLAAQDTSEHPQGGLTTLHDGDDPAVWVQVNGSPPPLSLGDRWTGHWLDSPRLAVESADMLRVSPHGRAPTARPRPLSLVLAQDPLPATGCAAWSLQYDIHGRPVEQLLAFDTTSAHLRTVANSVRAGDTGERTAIPPVLPVSHRHPSVVLTVYTLPHVVLGNPALQSTGLPEKMRGLGTLVPDGYTPMPGQVRAWFDDVAGVAMAVVVPVHNEHGQPAETHALLTDIQKRFALPGDIEPFGRGGHIVAEGGVHIGALPGALLVSTDRQVLQDLLEGHGSAWPVPAVHPSAAIGFRLAPHDDNPAIDGHIVLEDGTWRLDATGGTAPLTALQRARSWASIEP